MYTKHFLSWALLLLLLTTCSDDQPSGPILDCDDLNAVKTRFEDLNNNGILLQSVNKTGNNYQFQFENGETLSFADGCFDLVEENKNEWYYNIRFSDGKQLLVGYIGELNVEVTADPYPYSPLAAQVDVFAPREGRVQIRVIGKNGPDSDVIHLFEAYAKQHTLPILGLYPDHENQVEVSFTDQNGQLRSTKLIQINKAPLPDQFPEIIIKERKTSQMDGLFTLISYRGASDGNNKPFIMDAFGDIRWYYGFTGHPQLNMLGYDVGLERLANGNFYFGDWTSNAIHEVNMQGEVIRTWPLAGYGFHHNVQEKPDGNFLVTVNKWGSTHANGNNSVEDFIIELDRQTGAVLYEWDLRESLDEYRTVWANNLQNEYVDWFHANSVVYDASDQSIIVSGRLQGVAKLDYANNVKWIMSPHRGWNQNRRGEDLNTFLLQPLDQQANPITDQEVLDGYENHPEFEWNWYQHAVSIMPNGHLIMFDNGDLRNYGFDNRYSRALIFEVDDEARTVRQVWQYGKERGLETFSGIVSDADYLAARNNVLFAPGAFVNHGSDGIGAKLVEVNYDSKEVVFEVNLIGPGIVFHRAEKLELYP